MFQVFAENLQLDNIERETHFCEAKNGGRTWT